MRIVPNAAPEPRITVEFTHAEFGLVERALLCDEPNDPELAEANRCLWNVVFDLMVARSIARVDHNA